VRSLFVLVPGALVCGLALVSGQAPDRAPQTFRTGTEVVFVDVSVRDGSRAVTGLRVEDFELTDNGVRQRLESIEATAVPIDLTAIVDVSGNPGRPWTKRMLRSQVAARIEREIGEITRVLRPGDRIRVFATDTRVQQIVPLTDAHAVGTLPAFEFDGLSGLYDTLATVLLHPSEPARRHVIVGRTKGRDTISALTASSVEQLAKRSDALLHVVMNETEFVSEMALNAFQCDRNLMGICAPTRRAWFPYREHLYETGERRRLMLPGLAIAAAAEATGGRLHRTEVISEPTLTGTFRQVFDDFRGGYMLRYSPAGVARTGWHRIDVRVRGPRTYTVRARTGYGVDEPVPVPASPPVPPEPRSVQNLALAYERAAYSNLAAGLRRVESLTGLLRDFEANGNPWPASPHKEAAFAVELVEPAVFSAKAEERDAAYALLQRFTPLVRDPLEPGSFERYWHFALLTMLEGAIRPAAADAFVTRALQRFPGEPRFVLSRAIVTDQRWAVRGVTAVTGPDGVPTPAHVAQVRQQYEAGFALPEVAAEARIRLAWFLHRIGRHGEAVTHLAHAAKEPVRDPSLTYLRYLFLGHALVALGAHDQAAVAFETARKDFPRAQTPRVALMNLALLRGDRARAEALAEDVQASADDSLDPWWAYWQGQFRMYPAALQRLREMAR
jgi:VWFA-related protein